MQSWGMCGRWLSTCGLSGHQSADTASWAPRLKTRGSPRCEWSAVCTALLLVQLKRLADRGIYNAASTILECLATLARPNSVRGRIANDRGLRTVQDHPGNYL